MIEYHSGDIVRVFYPYTPKVMQKGNDNPGKNRFGLVINAGNNSTVALPILKITSHQGKTQHSDYLLREDEVRIPEGVTYFKRSKGRVPIYGVIKTERIEFFDDDEISKPLTTIDLETKIAVLKRYKHIMTIPIYVKTMNKESPHHQKAMEIFEQAIIAEKLKFLSTDSGKCMYEHEEHSLLRINKIQPMGKLAANKRIHVYAVKLTDVETQDSFFCTIFTMKKEKQIAKEWGKAKKGMDWLKEDERYYLLKKNIDREWEEPTPYPNRYMPFSAFCEKIRENSMGR